jgi:vanadium chloroperoxidase
MIHLPATEERAECNTNYILYWNNVAPDLKRIVATIGGPQSGPPSSARALGILHLAINDPYFAIKPRNGTPTTYLTSSNSDPAFRLPDIGNAIGPRQAVAGAA